MLLFAVDGMLIAIVQITNFRGLLILLVTCACLGCGRKKAARLDVYPVSGRILINGQPPTGADVYFHPRQPIPGLTTRPLAKVAPDGSFEPGTYLEHDGLPAGQYDLTVIWPQVTVVENEETIGADQLGGRFADPQHPVAEITVQSAAATIPPIDLKTR
jgi:hypothetical protein